jgi:hypothetical protein
MAAGSPPTQRSAVTVKVEIPATARPITSAVNARPARPRNPVGMGHGRAQRRVHTAAGTSGMTATQPPGAVAGPLRQENDLGFAQVNGQPIERKSDWKAWKRL